MNREAMFSSKKQDWETPQDFYDQLNKEFSFTLDPASTEKNHKCDKYFTQEQDGLTKSWQGETVFCNPPYGRGIGAWVEKGYLESRDKDTTVVMLLPSRTDTSWFHDWIYGKSEIRFIRGRLKFGGSKNSAPFPSMVVVYK